MTLFFYDYETVVYEKKPEKAVGSLLCISLTLFLLLFECEIYFQTSILTFCCCCYLSLLLFLLPFFLCFVTRSLDLHFRLFLFPRRVVLERRVKYAA